MVYLEKPKWFLDPPQFEAVECFLEDNLGCILFLLRANNVPVQQRRWGFPGGKVKPCETTTTAMQREFREETGRTMNGSQFEYIREVYVHYLCCDYYFTGHIFRLRLGCRPEIKLNPEEHQGYAWLPPHAGKTLHLMEDADRSIELVYGTV